MNRTFFIAGAQYHNLSKEINRLKLNDLLELKTEPENKFDPNAVRIMLGDSFLGYVPKKFSSEVTSMLEIGIYLECKVIELNPKGKPWEMCKVMVKEITEEEKIERGMNETSDDQSNLPNEEA
jgi:hypothetical protein